MESFLVSVIIVNYNSGDFLRCCVQSVLASHSPVELVIVDNHSEDLSLQSIRKLKSGIHRIKIIQNQANLGFSAAVNIGISQASSGYLFLLNPDCVIFRHTVTKLHEVISSDESIAVAGALVFNEDGSEQRGCRRYEPTLKRSMITALGLGKRYQGVDMTYQPLPASPQKVDAVSGAAMMVNRTLLGQVGGMDEDYFLHCEDLDICRKMRDGGYDVVFCPGVSVFHRQGGGGYDNLF